MAKILILYATVEGHTARVAERIAGRLTGSGHRVERQRAVPAQAAFDAASYEGVIVGASVHYGRHPAWLAALLRRHAASLQAPKTAFFSVSLGAKERYATKFLRKAGWRPQLTATFAGALQYSKYGPFKRMLVIAFAAVAGHDTDTTRDYEYTDWEAVDSFATAFSQSLT